MAKKDSQDMPEKGDFVGGDEKLRMKIRNVPQRIPEKVRQMHRGPKTKGK